MSTAADVDFPPAPSLPVGTHRLHRSAFINYQLNRIHSEGHARLDELRAAAENIRDFADFLPARGNRPYSAFGLRAGSLRVPQVDCVRELTALADRAEAEGRLANAAFYLRGASSSCPRTRPTSARSTRGSWTCFIARSRTKRSSADGQ